MRFGIRRPSLRGRISARTSWKRVVRHRMGLKMPRGFGVITNPRKFLYNKVYHATSFDALNPPKGRHRKARFVDFAIFFGFLWVLGAFIDYWYIAVPLTMLIIAARNYDAVMNFFNRP